MRTETDDVARARAAVLVVAAFAVGEAVQVNDGTLHPGAIVWLAVGIVAMVAGVCLPGEKLAERFGNVRLGAVIGLCAAVQWAQLAAWCVGGFASLGIASAMALAGIGVAMVLRGRRGGLVMLIAGHALAGACVIQATPSLRADVWHFQQQSTAALLHGENPYGVRYRNPYHPNTRFFGPGVVVDGWLTYSYPYPPLNVLVTAPARLLGDVRWAYLAAMELAAVVMVLAVRGRAGVLAGMMTLLMPRSLLVIMASWTEPMVVLMFAGVLWCAMRRARWLWVALGLLLGIKQYSMLLVPLTRMLVVERRDWVKLVARAGAVAAAIALPFLVWDANAFLRSVVLFQFRQPFRADALSFPALWMQLTGMEIGAAAGFLAAGGMIVWCMRRAERTPESFAASAAVVLVLFFAFNKQAFCNYYFLVASVTWMGAGMAFARAEESLSSAAQRPGRSAGESGKAVVRRAA